MTLTFHFYTSNLFPSYWCQWSYLRHFLSFRGSQNSRKSNSWDRQTDGQTHGRGAALNAAFQGGGQHNDIDTNTEQDL